MSIKLGGKFLHIEMAMNFANQLKDERINVSSLILQAWKLFLIIILWIT